MKKIKLTFDDGPTQFTPQILDILKKENIKATFFVLGKNLVGNQQIVRKIVSEGHIIANHGWSHHPVKSPLGLNWGEIKSTQKMLEMITPKIKKLFRPPYGIINSILAQKLKKDGYKIVMFDIVGHDWKKNIAVEKIISNILTNLKNNGIILLHDGFGSHNTGDRSKTVKALPTIIKKIKEEGFEFV